MIDYLELAAQSGAQVLLAAYRRLNAAMVGGYEAKQIGAVSPQAQPHDPAPPAIATPQPGAGPLWDVSVQAEDAWPELLPHGWDGQPEGASSLWRVQARGGHLAGELGEADLLPSSPLWGIPLGQSMDTATRRGGLPLLSALLSGERAAGVPALGFSQQAPPVIAGSPVPYAGQEERLLVHGGSHGVHSGVSPPATQPLRWQERVQTQQVDQAFRRDSRRYDAGFYLY